MKRAIIVSLLIVGYVCELLAQTSEVVEKVRNRGATATFDLIVVDDQGLPVKDVKGCAGFWTPYRNRNEVDYASSDENGHIVLSARCYYDGAFSLEKEGYYTTYKKHLFWRNADDAVEETLFSRRWMPTFKSRETLKKIRNPIPMIVNGGGLCLPIFGVACEFDLQQMDWCPPYGNGKRNDLCITVTGNYRKHYDDIVPTRIVLECLNEMDGIAIAQMDKWSSFKSFYEVPKNQPFVKRLEFNFAPWNSPLSSAQYLLFRIRTQKNSDGELLVAHYGKIYGRLNINPERKIQAFFVYFNPTPNDTNLEFDPERNLAPTTTREERERARVFAP